MPFNKFPFTMRTKLIASFTGVLIIFLSVAIFNLNQVGQIKKSMDTQNEKVDLKVMALELKEMVQELNIIASGLEISKKPEYIELQNDSMYGLPRSRMAFLTCRRSFLKRSASFGLMRMMKRYI
jgi:uncharacterized metal-binding protein